MTIIETERLRLRELTLEDAAFIFELVNDPAWLRYIGDRGVRTVEDAGRYILDGPRASYAQHGFGLYLAEQKENYTPLGICGILKRATLAEVDIGFAFLPRFRALGYACEAAAATLGYAHEKFGLRRIVAITSPNNERSIKLLEKLGFAFERMLHLDENSPEVKLFVWTFAE